MTTATAASNCLHASTPRLSEWRRYSHNGEDGVIASLFALLGTTDRQYVEIGCENGTECNTRLLRESGWTGWMFDRDRERSQIGLVKAHITRENVHALLQRHSVPSAFDLLSLDIDFNDFHVLDAILTHYEPRVVVVEYNASLGPAADAVVPYLPDHRWDGTDWFGASLVAFGNLGRVHGYVPVFCDSKGVNLFMVRTDVWGDRSHPALSAIFRPPAYGPHGSGHPSGATKRALLTSAHYLISGAARAHTRYGKISYLLNDEYIGATFAHGGYWEEAEVRQVAQCLGDVSGFALDVGAHVGSHAIALAALCPHLSFVCFEPQSVLRLLLERNVAENGLASRFVISPYAVADRDMKVTLAANFSDGSAAHRPIRYDGTTPSNYGGVQLGVDGEEVTSVSLDSLGLSPVVYVKLDVEGAEPLALAGARRMLEAQRPLLLLEHRADRRLPEDVLDRLAVPASVRALDVVGLLEDLGYSLRPLGQDHLAIPENRAERMHRPRADLRQPVSSASGATAGQDQEPTPHTPLRPTVDCTTTVPPILFQTWKSRTGLPASFARCRDSFLRLCDGFATPLWDDADNRAYLQEHFPWFLPIYDAYPKEIYRADAVRYFFLYGHGGIYADLDVYCLKPPHGVLEQPAAVLGRMGADPDFEHSVPNAVMASCPRHPFWLLVISKMIAAHTQQATARPEYLTGPVILKAALDEYGTDPQRAVAAIDSVASRLPTHLQPCAHDSVLVLSPDDWFPFSWADPIHQMYRQALRSQGVVPDADFCRRLFPKASLVTFWSHSWEPEPAARTGAAATFTPPACSPQPCDSPRRSC